MILEVTGLRKAGAVLEQAAQALRNGETLALPSECGYLRVGLAASAGYPLHLALQAPPLAGGAAQVAATLWPGPLRLRLEPEGPWWQLPAHPLARALLEQVGEPLAATDWLPEASGRATSFRPVPLRRPPEWEGLTLAWKEPCLGLEPSVADLSGPTWRWLRSGFVERRLLEWAGGQACLLSQA